MISSACSVSARSRASETSVSGVAEWAWAGMTETMARRFYPRLRPITPQTGDEQLRRSRRLGCRTKPRSLLATGKRLILELVGAFGFGGDGRSPGKWPGQRIFFSDQSGRSRGVLAFMTHRQEAGCLPKDWVQGSRSAVIQAESPPNHARPPSCVKHWLRWNSAHRRAPRRRFHAPVATFVVGISACPQLPAPTPIALKKCTCGLRTTNWGPEMGRKIQLAER
jgi:hypothetical protein